jgi:hypothetical protein
VGTLADRMSEADLDKAVRDLLKVHGLFGYHVPDSRGAAAGWPDWVIVGTRVLFRELKSTDGQLSPAQVRVRTLLQAAGSDWGLWRPADLVSGRIAQELAAVRVS